MPAPTMPPTTWAIMYGAALAASSFLVITMPMVTAGLMWQPEIRPMRYAMQSRLRPKARATPRMPTLGP